MVTVALCNNRSAMRIVESVKVLQGQELILFLGASVLFLFLFKFRCFDEQRGTTPVPVDACDSDMMLMIL